MNTLNARTHQRLSSGLIIMLAWSIASSVAALNFTEFTGLGHLPNGEPSIPDTGSTFASDVSADGSVIVGFGEDPNTAFYYTRSEGITSLASPQGFDGYIRANGISADGRVIVGANYRGGITTPESFRYTKLEGLTGLGLDHDSKFVSASEALAVSSDGSVIVGFTSRDSAGAGGLHIGALNGFRYSKSEGIDWIVDPASIGSNDSVGLTDISADGNVIVGGFDLGNKVVDGIFVEGNNSSPFRYTTSEGLIELENMDSASAISADGNVIVGDIFNGNRPEAILYTSSGEIVRLGDLPGGGFESSAIDVSGDGNIIIGQSDTGEGLDAFIWDNDSKTMESLYDALIADGLDLSEWSDLNVSAISDDGSTIVGSGTHNGNFEAFAARMFVVPVPAAIWLMGTALLGLLGFKRKQDC
jgi:uncharacterized membrane protein